MIDASKFVKDYGALIASSTALFIAVEGEWLKSLFFKPELEILDLKGFFQNHNLTVYRLIIKNVGNATAKSVQVDVIEIIDSDKKRENFLPVPLRWTHLDKESREILSNQTVYLDFVDYITQGLKISSLNCAVRFGTRFAGEISDFTAIKQGKSKITLRLYQANGQTVQKMRNIGNTSISKDVTYETSLFR